MKSARRDDALDTPPLEGEVFESAVLALTKNNGAAVDPEEREKVIKACHEANEAGCTEMVAFVSRHDFRCCHYHCHHHNPRYSSLSSLPSLSFQREPT